ncbi:MAG: NUDIX hydrolase [Lewinellaceae bacterium]|nr:NUDIX hydrolase [Lewinellaceae bacterium]
MAKQNVSLKARLILYYKGQILLLKQTKPNGGNYTLVGGNVESDESAKQSLIRESFEEAGITIREEDLHLVHVRHKLDEDKHRIVLYFKAYKWEGKLKARETHKFKEAEWFFLEELPKNLTDTVRHVLDEYRKGHLYSEFTDLKGRPSVAVTAPKKTEPGLSTKTERPVPDKKPKTKDGKGK